MINIEKVKEYAYRMHNDVNQLYGVHRYSYHLDGVANVLKSIIGAECHEELISAAYLHDILEDTKGTMNEILLLTNERVLDVVVRLTDKSGNSRKERHLNTYYLIRENEDAVIVKVADRIFNIRECILNNSNKAKMYFKENDGFKFALYDPRMKKCESIWTEYDNLILNIKRTNG